MSVTPFNDEMDYSDGEEEYQEVSVSRKSQNKSALKKRKRVGRACVHCQRSHMSCDDQRPCKRCVSRGCGDQCRDGKRKRRGRKRKSATDDDDEEDDEEFSSDEMMTYSPVKPKRSKIQEKDDEDAYVDVHSHGCTDTHPHVCTQHPAPQPLASRFHQPSFALQHPQPQVAAPVATYSSLLHPQPSYSSRMHTATHAILKQHQDDIPVRDFNVQTQAMIPLAPTPSPAPMERPATPHTPVPYLEQLNFAPASEHDLCVSGGWAIKTDETTHDLDLDHYFHTDLYAQRAQMLSFNYEMTEDSSSMSSDERFDTPIDALITVQ